MKEFKWPRILVWEHMEIVLYVYRAFNIFQVDQYFTIYRLFLKFEHFSWKCYATIFEIRRYQLPFKWLKVPGTTPYWKICVYHNFFSLFFSWSTRIQQIVWNPSSDIPRFVRILCFSRHIPRHPSDDIFSFWSVLCRCFIWVVVTGYCSSG